MAYSELEEFAKILVRDVRDAAIKTSDADLRPKAKGCEAERWRHAIRSGNPEHIIKKIVPDIVDEVIAQLLWAIDDGRLHLVYKTSTGTTVDLAKEHSGELVGWYMGEWRETLSSQRCNDLTGL